MDMLGSFEELRAGGPERQESLAHQFGVVPNARTFKVTGALVHVGTTGVTLDCYNISAIDVRHAEARERRIVEVTPAIRIECLPGRLRDVISVQEP